MDSSQKPGPSTGDEELKLLNEGKTDEAKKEEAENDGGQQTPDFETESSKDTVDFIKKKFRLRKCNRYVKDNGSDKGSDKGPENDLCCCGYKKAEHDQKVNGVAESDSGGGREGGAGKWKVENDTELDEVRSMDAFGDIEFPGDFGHKKGKYIVVDYEADVEDLWSLMRDHWSMKRPHLLISVTGGAKDYNPSTMDSRLKEAFCKGLIQAAESTGAWIITGGTNEGVMKVVGEAMRQRSKKRLVALGVASWGCIENRDSLKKDNAKYESSEYELSDSKGGGSGGGGAKKKTSKESALDRNHTHFILVDDGTKNKYGVEISLRAKLEKRISQKDDFDVPVPVICIVLEGGRGTIKTAREAIDNGTPVLVIEGSGRAADILAEAYHQFQQNDPDKSDEATERIWSKIKKLVEEKLKTDADKTNEAMVHIKKCICNGQLMNVFRFDDRKAAENIDKPIIDALLKARQKDEQGTNLKLAVSWNRLDIAQRPPLPGDEPLTVSSLEDPMFIAIVCNKVEFVRFFLEKGVRLSELLKKDKYSLNKFYDKILRRTDYLKGLTKKEPTKTADEKEAQVTVDQNRLETKLRNLVNKLYSPLQEKTVLKGIWPFGGFDDDEAARQLFYWSVIARLPSMAMIFWYEAKEKLTMALVGHLMSKKLEEEEKDLESKESLTKQVTLFEELSTKVLSECYGSDHQMAADLLVRKLPDFSHLTCLEFAVSADNSAFLAHSACQKLLTDVWMGKLSEENHVIKLLMSMILFPLSPFILKFKPKRKDKMKSEYEMSARKRSVSSETRAKAGSDATEPKKSSKESTAIVPSYFIKLRRFFKAPVVKFGYNCLSYVALLMLFGIILLTEFFPTISTKEIVLIAWIGTIMMEEGRQILSYALKNTGVSLYNYITDIWNILDLLAATTFIVGIILRVIPISICEQCFYVSRFIFALNFMMFFFRILHMFSIHRQLGPKLVMIGKMMIDLFYFMTILMVFIMAYGVASHVVLYPNQTPSIGMVRDVLSGAWWSLYGEFNIEEVSGENCAPSEVHSLAAEVCASMEKSDLNRTFCPGKEQNCPTNDWFGPILLAIYALITNVMMINLLIAMFSNTFSKVEEVADVVWKIQRCNLVLEYESRPILPPPLIIFEHLFLVLRWICRHLPCLKVKSDSGDPLSVFQKSRLRLEFGPYYQKDLTTWLNINVEEFLAKKEKEEAEETTKKDTPKRVDEILHQLKRIDVIEEKLDRLILALEGNRNVAQPSPKDT